MAGTFDLEDEGFRSLLDDLGDNAPDYTSEGANFDEEGIQKIWNMWVKNGYDSDVTYLEVEGKQPGASLPMYSYDA